MLWLNVAQPQRSRAEQRVTHKTTECCDSSLAESKLWSTLIHRWLLPLTNYSRRRENGFPAVLLVCAFSCTDSNLAALHDKILFNITVKSTVSLKGKDRVWGLRAYKILIFPCIYYLLLLMDEISMVCLFVTWAELMKSGWCKQTVHKQKQWITYINQRGSESTLLFTLGSQKAPCARLLMQ